MTPHFLSDVSLAVRRLILLALTGSCLGAAAFVYTHRQNFLHYSTGDWLYGLLWIAVILVQWRAYQVANAGFARMNEANTLLHTIVDTTPGVIYAKDREGRMLLANAAALELIGKPWNRVKDRTDAQFLSDPVQGEAIMANDRRVMESGTVQELEELVGSITWLSTKTPMRSSDGTVSGIVGISVDITERKQVEERLRQMVNELNHRVKNTLTTVQSIVSRTLVGNPPSVRRTLEMRLVALAATHDVLTRESWEGATVMDIVTGILAPHEVPQGSRFRIGGPDLKLVPRAALAISLALHELATNAAKFGALSCDAGRVDLFWDTLPDEDFQFRLRWTECGGPTVLRPTHRGFGTSLVERGVAHDLGGTARIEFEPTGIVCEIRAPLEEIAVTTATASLPRVGSMR